MSEEPTEEILEPEIVPPEPGDDDAQPAREPGRWERALGPVLAGLTLDLVDLTTFGPMGMLLGLFVGAGVGWYLTGVLGLPRKWRRILTALAAIYCMIPFTEFVPAATVFGALGRFFEPGEKQSEAPVEGET